MTNHCDFIIRRVTVLDGTGGKPFVSDVAIAGDRFAAVGELDGVTAAIEMYGGQLAVAPGFIDVHTHDDNALLIDPHMSCKITQGVTTVVAGNCGISLPPLVRLDPPPPLDLLGGNSGFRFAHFGEYVAAVERSQPAVNAALMIGHMTLRVAVMRDLGRAASDGEIEAMRRHVHEALSCGAIGLSTGLFYPPSSAATADEVAAILEELRGTGAIYTTHMRDESDGVERSLDESFKTAHRAGVPVVISHHKCMGTRNFGRSISTLAKIEAARQRQSVGLDAYPYTAGSTALLAKLIGESSRIVVSWSRPHPELAGQDLAAIAAKWGISLPEALTRLQPGGGIYFMMDEADVERILAYTETMIGSDGLPHDQIPHPRLWGTFPRVLGHYCRVRRLFPIEEAVRRMTSLPAERFGLVDRGVVRAGAFADLVMFDPNEVTDMATIENPTRPAKGIHTVFVNGSPVLHNGKPNGYRPGRIIRRSPIQAGDSSHAV